MGPQSGLVLLAVLAVATIANGFPLQYPPGAIVQEVKEGRTAILHCHSNDDDHNFLYWQIADDGIVGPQNPFNEDKYNYEILSGKLFINKVSQNESGLYNCVSKGVIGNDIKIQPVVMVVVKDWEDVWESDPTVNFFRILGCMGVGFFASFGVYFLYAYYKQKRHSRFLESSDEDENEVFIRPGPSQPLTDPSDRLLNAEQMDDFNKVYSKISVKAKS